MGTVQKVLQAKLEIFEMFKARQQRTHKVSFVRYSLGNSLGIECNPVLKSQLTFRERMLNKGYLIVHFAEVVFQSALEMLDILSHLQVTNSRAGYSKLRISVEHVHQCFLPKSRLKKKLAS